MLILHRFWGPLTRSRRRERDPKNDQNHIETPLGPPWRPDEVQRSSQEAPKNPKSPDFGPQDMIFTDLEAYNLCFYALNGRFLTRTQR